MVSVGGFLVNTEFPYDPAIALLGAYPKKVKTSVQTKLIQ